MFGYLSTKYFVCSRQGVLLTHGQGLKKCKFPAKLVKISHGLQVEDDRSFMTLQKKHCTQEPYHCVQYT